MCKIISSFKKLIWPVTFPFRYITNHFKKMGENFYKLRILQKQWQQATNNNNTIVRVIYTILGSHVFCHNANCSTYIFVKYDSSNTEKMKLNHVKRSLQRSERDNRKQKKLYEDLMLQYDAALELVPKHKVSMTRPWS